MINKAEYRPFNEPWHAQIFALTVHLNEQGHFAWKDWSKVFSGALSSKASKELIINDECPANGLIIPVVKMYELCTKV